MTYLKIDAVPASPLLHTYLPPCSNRLELRQSIRFMHDRRIAVDLLLLELEDHLEFLVLRQDIWHQHIKVVVGERGLSNSHDIRIVAQHFLMHLLQELVHARSIRAVLVRPLELLIRILDAGVW